MYCHSCSLCRPLGAHSWHHYPPPLCRLHPLRKCCNNASPRHALCMCARSFCPATQSCTLFDNIQHALRKRTRHPIVVWSNIRFFHLPLCVPMRSTSLNVMPCFCLAGPGQRDVEPHRCWEPTTDLGGGHRVHATGPRTGKTCLVHEQLALVWFVVHEQEQIILV